MAGSLRPATQIGGRGFCIGAPNPGSFDKFIAFVHDELGPHRQRVDPSDGPTSTYFQPVIVHATLDAQGGRVIDAEALQDGVDGHLKDVAGVLIPGGFGERGVEGKIKAAKFAPMGGQTPLQSVKMKLMATTLPRTRS